MFSEKAHYFAVFRLPLSICHYILFPRAGRDSLYFHIGFLGRRKKKLEAERTSSDIFYLESTSFNLHKSEGGSCLDVKSGGCKDFRISQVETSGKGWKSLILCHLSPLYSKNLLLRSRT